VIGANVVILTVPWNAMEVTLRLVGDLKGTVVVDVSFPYKKSQREALRGSTAEEIPAMAPEARVIKAWNHVHAKHLTDPGS
jgi:8-hydroxy-5-deazaflavin:NADPH oxidoreductase